MAHTTTTTIIDERLHRLMASASAVQHGNGTWTASVASMNTMRGYGQTKDDALAALSRKLRRVIARQSA